MFTLPHSSPSTDYAILRAARMQVQHHPSIPPVRPSSAIEAARVERIILTSFVRGIAQEAR